MRASKAPAALLLLLLALVELHANRSNDEVKEKSSPRIMNVCDIRDRNSKLHCYCELNQEINRAVKTECWVFNGGIEKADPIWTSFSTQTNIETLAFNVRADGALKFVPTKLLRYLQKLKKISIKFSSITEVEENTFVNLTSIEEITMIKNQIEHLNKHSFNNLPNLVVLILDENNIKEIVTDTFFKLTNLQKLYFTSNNVSVIQDGAFRHLVNLLELELDKNNISELRKECFEGLAKLKRLDLSHNKISLLNSFVFTELWNLESLLLDYNEISIVAQRSFDGLSQLKKLNLNHNNLIILAGGLFAGVRGLLGLDLRFNKLKRFTSDDVKPIYDNLLKENSYIYLEGNELPCDCHLAWMHKLRHETRSTKTRTSLENFACKLSTDLVLNSQLALFEKSVISANNNYNVDNKNLENLDDNTDDIFQDEIDENNLQEIEIVKKENEGTLLQIPIDLLPCPQDVKVTDRTYTYPSQNEAKDYRNLIHSSPGSFLYAN
ncbi:connectin-like [Achroia grisella]|uniref:connectin-like n=1 Tax=Achroia grisella TaxID=688607 RepID=UPI0027D22E31|nr:connectin-like [Achroia grisella]